MTLPNGIPESVKHAQPITMKMSIHDFRIVANDLVPIIRDLLLEHGPLNEQTIWYLLRREGIDINQETVGTILQGWATTANIVLLPDTDWLYGFLGEFEQRTSTYPHVTDYVTAYLDLYTRWRAVRANPALLELTDEYIDALHLPQPETGQP